MKHFLFIITFVLALAPVRLLASEPDRHAYLLQPAEDIILQFAEDNGLSIISDSRLLRDREIPPVDAQLPAIDALRKSLATVGLGLTKVNDATYAITPGAVPGPRTHGVSIDVAPAAPKPIKDIIIVTASALTTSQFDGTDRIYTIGPDLIELFNVNEPADAVYALPQSLASVTAANTALFGPAAGLNLVDLRGLGSNRTHVTFNGRRGAITAGGNGAISGVDMNGIAQSFLERIEVAGFSQTASLAPEAVAGSVNFVPRYKNDGIEMGGRFGISERADAEEYSAYILGGDSFAGSRGRYSLGFNYSEDTGLLGAARPETALNFGLAENGFSSSSSNAVLLPGFGGSLFSPEGLIRGAINRNGDFIETSSDLGLQRYTFDGEVEAFTLRGDQLYNWSLLQNTLIPSTRWNSQYQVEFDLNGSTRLFLEGNLSQSKSRTQLSPVPTPFDAGADAQIGNAVAVPLDNSFLPAAVRDFATEKFGDDIYSIVITRRFEEVGPRRDDINRTYANAYAGLEKDFSEDTYFTAFYRFGFAGVRRDEFNRVDRGRLGISLNESACALVAGCAPLDIFSGNGSQAAADFIRADPSTGRYQVREHELYAALQQSLTRGILRGGTLSVDASVRHAGLDFLSADLPSTGVIGSFVPPETSANLTTGEIGTQITLPLKPSQPMLQEVDFSASYRLTTNNPTGIIHNAGTSLTWKPFKALSLFASASRGARPPTIIELFFVGQGQDERFIDPCGLAANSVPETVVANCQSDGPLGVPTEFQQTSPSTFFQSVGNPALDSEEITTWRAGASLNLNRSIPGELLLYGAWHDYRVDDFIERGTNTLTSCYLSVGLSDAACGSNANAGGNLIQRDPQTGQVTTVFTQLTNTGELRWQGADAELRYAYQPEVRRGFDRLWLSALHTYTDRVSFTSVDGTDQRFEGTVNYPHNRTLVLAGIDWSGITLSTLIDRRGSVVTDLSGLDRARIPAVTTADLSAKFDIGDQSTVVFSVQNILDRDPPIGIYGTVGLVPAEHYDLIGRRFSLNIRKVF
ncbi:MAG: TonB-dependent receptor [Pseudomonadota bacterium]